MCLVMGMIAGVAYVDDGTTEPENADSGRRASSRADKVPPMRRLLTPVKHVLWYLGHHTQSPRSR